MFTAKARAKCDAIYEKYYGGRKFHDSLYRDLIRKHSARGAARCSTPRGRYLRFCKEFSSIASVVGIDLDSVLETNNSSAPFGMRGDLGALPFSSSNFDMVISRSVVEHLTDPVQVFSEFWRVLRPGGKVVIITPNKYDYVSVIAALTPYKLHRYLVSRIFQVPEDDVFPTLYRANTIGAIRKAFTKAGFVPTEVDTMNHYPAYLMFSPTLFDWELCMNA